jgi:hypothetical protein
MSVPPPPPPGFSAYHGLVLNHAVEDLFYILGLMELLKLLMRVLIFIMVLQLLAIILLQIVIHH